MKLTSLALGALAALLVSGCATREPMPFASATDCFYPACSIDVEVVDDGKGGKTLKVAGDGNVRMGTRHKVVAIVWNLRTPGYEFRRDSLAPQSRSSRPGQLVTPTGVWSQEIFPHGYWYDSISVTNLNNVRGVLQYRLTVYPARGTPGTALSQQAAVMNDPCPNDATWCR